MIGFEYSAGGFFYTLLTILLSSLCAQSVGLLISCTLLDFKQAITFTSIFMLTIMLLGGFYVKNDQIPIWLRWASYLSFSRYTYYVLAYVQFSGRTMECGDPNGAPVGRQLNKCTREKYQ